MAHNRLPTEMEVRVARDICGAMDGGKIMGCAFANECVPCLSLARAAIRSMREPTPGMMDAYLSAEPMLDDEGWNGPAAKVAWQAMIDAASPPDTQSEAPGQVP